MVDHFFDDKLSAEFQNIIDKNIKNNIKPSSQYACPGCGAGIQINTTSICSYCGSSIDERFSPYVL